MKKFIIFYKLFLLICKNGFNQEIAKPITRADFLQKKGKRKKRLHGFLLGAGLASFALVAPGNTSFSTTGTVVVLGALSILSSIPLFIATAEIKEKQSMPLPFEH